MKFLQCVVFAFTLLQQRAMVLSAPENRGYTVKEDITSPRGWVRHSQPPPNHKIILRIALPQRNFDVLERHLYEVSDPAHARYGQYLSQEEVEQLVAPHPESVAVVNDWLESMGFNELDIARSSAGDWITIKTSVGTVESMLNTKYHVWKHVDSEDYLIRTTGYSVPSYLQDHIELVQPTTMFGRFKADKSHVFRTDPLPLETSVVDEVAIVSENSALPIGSSCNYVITIKCLQQLYNVSKFIPTGENNSIGITGYLWKDRSAPFNSDEDTPTNSNEPYSTWLDFILAHPNPPLTISTSYGDDEQTVPKSYAKRVCEGFAQLGARGVSLIFSSGDFGVGDGNEDPASQSCISNDGSNRTMFLPAFPASCPYVTSVGGTSHIPEVAVSTFFSGGGFSNLFPRPAYQNEAVETFLKKHPKEMYQGLFNRDGRGIPDVAAQADLFKVYVDGHAYLIGGTSAASPTFAGFVAMLNEVRLRAGKPSLGFLNPFLYSEGLKGLNDITKGHNGGCGTPGFNATKGWDPVTGLGTPNFGKLKELV